MNFSLLMYYLVQEKHKVDTVAPSWIQQHRNTQNTPAHTSNIYRLPQSTTCVINHAHPTPGDTTFPLISDHFSSPLHKTHNLQPFQHPRVSLRSFSKESVIIIVVFIYCVCVSVFLNHLACVKRCYPFFYQLLIFFNGSLTKFWVLCP